MQFGWVFSCCFSQEEKNKQLNARHPAILRTVRAQPSPQRMEVPALPKRSPEVEQGYDIILKSMRAGQQGETPRVESETTVVVPGSSRSDEEVTAENVQDKLADLRADLQRYNSVVTSNKVSDSNVASVDEQAKQVRDSYYSASSLPLYESDTEAVIGTATAVNVRSLTGSARAQVTDVSSPQATNAELFVISDSQDEDEDEDDDAGMSVDRKADESTEAQGQPKADVGASSHVSSDSLESIGLNGQAEDVVFDSDEEIQ
ncbi:hypothetical protein JX265_007852 [Neoarthrinium moseri]|uniref:Uncharacterized protein n=1 Tax=Neoarthrinium moseri TaxID=1658444 RepID=A0A9P9WJG2_9PEZI|nr:hypothetical protein JX265_007852 [Neoarthrinium moseri]